MKILVIGSGGREYAICKAFNSSKNIGKVYAIPGCNLWDKVESFPDIAILDFIKIKEVVLKNKIDFVFVGPETPIIHGIYDFLKEHDIKAICPTKFCSQIESSKIFSKNLMNIFNVPTAKSDFAITFSEYKNKIINFQLPIVLKSDNDAAGKGVIVTNDLDEANNFALELLEKNKFGKNNKVLIEECLIGEEFSLMCLINHDKIIALPPICDHKAINENNQGLMTGGMGVYNNPNFLTKKDIDICVETCIKPVIDGIKDSNPYFGILFAGIMKDKSNGFKVIEYNIRFGDPETEILLPLIQNDFLELILDFFIYNKTPEISYHDINSIGIVVSAKNYPLEYTKNIDLNFLKQSENIIPMGMYQNGNNIVSSGGRVFMYTKSGNNFEKLFKDIYNELNELIPNDIKKLIHYRKDIGKRNI